MLLQTDLEIASPYQKKKGPIIFLQVSNCKIDFPPTERNTCIYLTTTPCKHFIPSMITFYKTLLMNYHNWPNGHAAPKTKCKSGLVEGTDRVNVIDV